MSENLTNEEKLDRMLRLTEENHKILKSLHRVQYVSNIFRALYWTLIIASLGGAYYFIKPMFSSFSGGGTKTGLFEQINSLRSQLPEAKILEQMLTGGGQ